MSDNIYRHSLDRAERGMAVQFPLLMFLHGGAAAWTAIVLASPVILFVLLYFHAYHALFLYLLPVFMFTMPVAIFSYFTYAHTLVHLNRTACWFLTIVMGTLLLFQITTFVRVVLRHPDPTSAFLSAVAFAGVAWLTCAMVFGLFRLARLGDLDRALLRAPFDGMANGTAFQYFCGLPPIIKFVRGLGGTKARVLILASSVCFSF